MYKRIMIIMDDHKASQAALAEGLRVAEVHGGEVVFFIAMQRFPPAVAEAPYVDAVSMREFENAARADADSLLATATAAADRAGIMSHGIVADESDEVERIVEAARRRRCDLIVVASEGRNALMRLLTGSVIPGLITASPVPVLVCKPQAPAKAIERESATSEPPRTARRRRPDRPGSEERVLRSH